MRPFLRHIYNLSYVILFFKQNVITQSWIFEGAIRIIDREAFQREPGTKKCPLYNQNFFRSLILNQLKYSQKYDHSSRHFQIICQLRRFIVCFTFRIMVK